MVEIAKVVEVHQMNKLEEIKNPIIISKVRIMVDQLDLQFRAVVILNQEIA